MWARNALAWMITIALVVLSGRMAAAQQANATNEMDDGAELLPVNANK